MIPNIKLFQYEKKKYIILAHPLRYAIMQYLDKTELKTVNDVANHFNLRQCVCSLHLSKLYNLGALNRVKDAKEVYYSVNHQYFKK